MEHSNHYSTIKVSILKSTFCGWKTSKKRASWFFHLWQAHISLNGSYANAINCSCSHSCLSLGVSLSNFSFFSPSPLPQRHRFALFSSWSKNGPSHLLNWGYTDLWAMTVLHRVSTQLLDTCSSRAAHWTTIKTVVELGSSLFESA